MSFVTIDFETFYDNDTGFKKQNTEEYINDPRFHVIGMGIKVDDDPTEWFTTFHTDKYDFKNGRDAVETKLRSIDWSNSAVLCHNALFDCAILSWRYGVRPAFIYDTLCMARAIHGVDAGGSLAALAERYALGKKGDEVINAFGMNIHQFTPYELTVYGEYCKNDVELCYALFHKLMEGSKA